MAYNYALAFVEYCKGTPLEEVALVLGIPEETLRNRAMTEHWSRVASELPAKIPNLTVVPQGKGKLEAQALLLQENREENYKGWVEMRSHALKLIKDLGEGKLKMKRYWHNRGAIIERECELSIADMTALANYYQIICNGSYLALGDRGATDGGSSKGGMEGVAAHAPAITIVLPGAVSVPRDQRAEVHITSTVKAKVEQPIVEAEVLG